MKVAIQLLILVWFIVASALVLIGGISLVVAGRDTVTAAPDPPPLPQCVADCTNPKAFIDLMEAYKAQATAYEKQLAVMKAKADAERSPALETYKAVAKETFQPLLTTILTALVGYAFVKSAATIVNNQLLTRNNQPPERLNLP